MALEYSMKIAGSTQCAALAERLCSLPEYRQVAEGVIAPGLQVHIGRPGPLEIEMIEEEFGFTPTASVTFRRDKDAEPVAVRTRLLRGSLSLLEGGTNDTVLLFNGETVILLRRNGKLVLNPLEGFWTEEVLAVIPTPHEFESIRSI
jgi:hypothetical protein